jgi:hypothetical protein
VAEERVRLLLCLDEGTLEALPDYEGPPEYDYLLQYLIDNKHTHPMMGAHRGNLISVPKKYWDSPKQREAIIEQITSSGALGEGLGSEFDAVKHTFEDDAMSCWTKEHNKDPACPDYRSEKKLIKPNTKAERAELGLPKYEETNAPKRYLCDFCIVDTLVRNKLNKQR